MRACVRACAYVRVHEHVCTLSLPTVTCSSSLSAASEVVILQSINIPVIMMGSTLAFSCSERQSTCGSNGQWSPDPEIFSCSTPGKLAITRLSTYTYTYDTCVTLL